MLLAKRLPCGKLLVASDVVRVTVNLINDSLVQADNNGLLNFIITLQCDGDLDYIV